MQLDIYQTDVTKGLAKASIGMQAEADVTGKHTDTGLGKADSEQARPGLRQDEASGSQADSECVTGLAGLMIGTECGKKKGRKKPLGILEMVLIQRKKQIY